MKLCFNAGPEPLEEYFPFAHENGFPWMELTCNNPKNFLDKFDATRIDNIKRLRDKYNLRYGLHSASFVNSAEIEPTVRVAAEQHLIAYMELAHQLEAEYIVLHFGYHFSLFREEVFRCLKKTYTPVVELAEKYELPIGIENMNKMHEDCEVAYLGVYIDEFTRMFEALPSKYFGLTLDIAHASLLPEGPEGFMDAFPDLTVSMDSLITKSDKTRFYWTLTGTNSVAGGTGNKVKISGFEEWTLSKEGLVQESKGYFNAEEYNRQLNGNTAE